MNDLELEAMAASAETEVYGPVAEMPREAWLIVAGLMRDALDAYREEQIAHPFIAACPKCGAPPALSCLNETGGGQAEFHPERYEAAKAALSEALHRRRRMTVTDA